MSIKIKKSILNKNYFFELKFQNAYIHVVDVFIFVFTSLIKVQHFLLSSNKLI